MATKDPQFAYTLRIPKDRIAVLIGVKGAGKRYLESVTKTKLEINSSEGEISIAGEDALNLYVCREIVLAIGRGFSPELAQLLLKPDYGIDMLNVKDFAKTDNDAQRLKGRVIGEEGKSRRTIEELTGVHVTVYGKTVGLIGELEALPDARKAIESLLSGQPHASVYKWLENRRKEQRKRHMDQWLNPSQ